MRKILSSVRRKLFKLCERKNFKLCEKKILSHVREKNLRCDFAILITWVLLF